MSIEVSGLKRLSRKFDKLGKGHLVEEIVLRELGVTAEETKNRALDLLNEKVYSTPLPEGVSRTGNLKKNVHVERLTAEKGYRVYVPVDYAVYVEFGTGTKGDPSVPHTTRACWHIKLKNGDVKESWRTVTGAPPRPFLRPAFNEQKSKCVKRIKASLQSELSKIKGESGNG